MSEAKHILEWYEELPEPYRSAAIANYDENWDLNTPSRRIVESLAKAIMNGFEWEVKGDIPGYLSWNDLHAQLYRDTFVPPSPYPQIKTTFLEGIEL